MKKTFAKMWYQTFKVSVNSFSFVLCEFNFVDHQLFHKYTVGGNIRIFSMCLVNSNLALKICNLIKPPVSYHNVIAHDGRIDCIVLLLLLKSEL